MTVLEGIDNQRQSLTLPTLALPLLAAYHIADRQPTVDNRASWHIP